MTTHHPLIAIAGRPTWANRAERLLHQHAFDTARYDDPAVLIERLIEDYPALLLADGDVPGWSFWVTTPKTEQATRRIPILVITRDSTREHEVTSAGATAGLWLGNLERDLISQINAHSRRSDPALLDALARQCAQPLPPLARLGVEKFNAGAYYDQHNAFEKQWMEEPGPVRNLYRAVLQVGVAYYHLTRGNYAGGLRMLERSVQWFWELPDVCQGINVRQLREDAAHVRSVLQAINPENPLPFDSSLLKPISLIEK